MKRDRLVSTFPIAAVSVIITTDARFIGPRVPPVPVPAFAPRAADQGCDRRRSGCDVQRPLARRKAGQAADRRTVWPARGCVAGAWRRDVDDGWWSHRTAAPDAASGRAGGGFGFFE